MLEIFSFLDGISPLWWFGFSLILGFVEISTLTFFLLGPSVAALAICVLLLISPSLTGNTQVVIFTVLSVVLTLILRGVIKHFGDGGAKLRGLNERGSALIGRTGKVVSITSQIEGAIMVGDTRWHAIWTEGEAIEGATARVVEVDGMTLKVAALET